MPKFNIKGLLLAFSLLALVACESADLRAEKHYQAAIKFLEAGDTPRAIIEFKNVFKLNGQHKEARLAYAILQRERGETGEASSQFLRLVEEYPKNFTGRLALAEMALETAQWNEVDRHIQVAAEIDPENLLVRSIMANLEYYNAAIDKNGSDIEAAVTRATQLISADPTLISSHRLIIGDSINRRDWRKSLAAINSALTTNPEARDLYSLKLGVLVQLNDKIGVENHLMSEVKKDPENQEKLAQLVQWYISEKEYSKAESFLRDIVKASEKPHIAQVDLIKFIADTRGLEEAKLEVIKLIAENPEHHFLFSSIKSTLDYQTGLQDKAITDLEALLKDEPNSEEADNIKIALSRMFTEQNNPVGARALVEEVLATSPNHLEAVKSKAAWLIKDDDTTAAIASLRTSLGQYPNNASLLTLMAQAHQREGNRDLMSEMLALAVEASNSAPAESLRYARHLNGVGKTSPAESVLLTSRRIYPENLDILILLTEIYASAEDWGSASEMIGDISKIGTVQSKAVAEELTSKTLAAQNRESELLAFLGQLSTNGESNQNQVELAIIQSYLNRDSADQALAHISSIEEKSEDLQFWNFVKVKIFASESRFDDAIKILDELIDSGYDQSDVFVELYKVYLATGNTQQATKTIDAAIKVNPDSQNLKWFKAGDLEKQKDFDGAIAVYEAMYSVNSESPIIANNLASLLSSYRDDQDSLNRAFIIARRFKDSPSAPAQDTYGWIAYRLGNFQDALKPLETARAALPENADIAFHLGMTYAALENNQQALSHLKSALSLIDTTKPPKYAGEITSEIDRLSALE